MVEPSFPPSRVGAAAVPDSIFLTRQMMILLGLPGACSAVPHSPVSGNVSSTRGLPLAGPGIGSTPLLGGMSLKMSFIPSGSGVLWLALRLVHPAPCRPCCCASWRSISPSVSWCLGDRGGIPAAVSANRSSCRDSSFTARRLLN